MKLYFVNLHTQFGNTGDALINRELIRKLRTCGRVFANCGDDIQEDFIRDLEIKPEEQLRVKNTYLYGLHIINYAIKAKLRKDTVYVVGGLGDFSGGGIKVILKDILVYIMYIVYRIFGVRIIYIGRSFSNLTKGKEKSEKLRSSLINEYYVRDYQTLEYCHKIGIKGAKYCPDLSWLLTSYKNSINVSCSVGITFRTSGKNNTQFDTLLLEKTNLLLKMIQEHLKAPLKIIVFHQVDSDKAFMEKIKDSLVKESKYEVTYIPERLHLGKDEELYSMCRYHISNRLHSLLLGYKYGSLPIALLSSNNKKICATFEDAKLNGLIMELNNSDQQIESSFIELLNKEDCYFTQLLECESRMRLLIHNTVEDL